MKTVFMTGVRLVFALTIAFSLQAQAQVRTPERTPSAPAPPSSALPVSPARGPTLDSTARNTPPLSPWAAEVAKLARSNIEEGVILSFIDNVEGTFNLGADQIIYLRDLGVAPQVISTMIQHDYDVITGVRPVVASTVPDSDLAFHLKFIMAPADDVKSTEATAASQVSSGSATNVATAICPPAPPESVFPAAQPAGAGNSFPYAAGMATGSSASAPAAKLYAVREPYPEEVTAPIFIFRGAWPAPNTLIVVSP